MSNASKAPVSTYIKNNKRGIFSIQGRERHPYKLRQGDSMVLDYDLWSTANGATRRELIDATATGTLTIATRVLLAGGAVLDIPFGGNILEAVERQQSNIPAASPEVVPQTVAAAAATKAQSDGFTVVAAGSKQQLESMGLRLTKEQPVQHIHKSGFTAVSDGKILSSNITPPVENAPAGIGTVVESLIVNRVDVPPVTVVSAPPPAYPTSVSANIPEVISIAAPINTLVSNPGASAVGVSTVMLEEPVFSAPVEAIPIEVPAGVPAKEIPAEVPADVPAEEPKTETIEDAVNALYGSKSWSELMGLLENNFPDIVFNRKSVVSLKSYTAIKRKYNLPY